MERYYEQRLFFYAVVGVGGVMRDKQFRAFVARTESCDTVGG